ncbi:LysR family transcriptional regulator [Actinomadura macrotermitis]|uniref:HTH-type transcriptional regulator HdfR n=1 Tax=Actinomadura macrotermitis TaxID=2585200 RepID=A0A7K0C3C4_9ACTN|nr:HTH-type transcriptional regulator HdfR [Actinomadura macrotermitis]
MDLRQLECFLAVAEELHFGRAAERLNVVQPSVSQQIQRLERGLGVRLFDRTSRQVALTAAGMRLVPEARAIMSAVERAAAAVREDGGSVLRLGTADVLGERLDVLLELFGRRLPGGSVNLVQVSPRERLERVRSGALDAALIRSAAPVPGVRLRPLWEDRVVAAIPAAHRLAANARLRLRDLGGLPLRLVPREDNATFVDKIMASCRAAGFEPRLGPPFTGLQDTLVEIAFSDGSWTVLYEATGRIVSTRRIAVRPLDDPGLSVTTYLVTGENPGPAARALLDACAEEFTAPAAPVD